MKKESLRLIIFSPNLHRFQEERKRRPLAAEAFAKVAHISANSNDTSASKPPDKPHLGQIICGAAQTRGKLLNLVSIYINIYCALVVFH